MIYCESYRGKFRSPDGRDVEITVKEVTAEMDHTGAVCDHYAEHVITRINGEIVGVADSITLDELSHVEYVEAAIGDTIRDAIEMAQRQQNYR